LSLFCQWGRPLTLHGSACPRMCLIFILLIWCILPDC